MDETLLNYQFQTGSPKQKLWTEYFRKIGVQELPPMSKRNLELLPSYF